jgi:tetratricopeptide (TPR) repeat protein
MVLGPDPLRLNPAVLASDVVAFEQALARGDVAGAVALYRGPFLDGFHLDGQGEYERWVETERTRFALAYRGALERLAIEEDARGNLREAVEWWRRLALDEPLDARVMVRLMGALARSGDRAGALSQARVYQQLVQEELGAGPDPEVLALIDELRRAGEGSRLPVPPGVTSHGGHVQQGGRSPVVATSMPVPPLARRRRWRGWWLRTAAALVVVAPVAVLIGVWSRPNTGAGRLHDDRIVVAPFHLSSPDSSLTHLREGIALLLAARFTGEGGPRAIAPAQAFAAWHRATPPPGNLPADAETGVARALGAGSLLVGEVVRLEGNELTLSAKLVSLVAGRRFEATAQGPADSLPALADRLAAVLLARLAGEPERRIPSLAAVSLPALRAFLAGRAAYRSGRYEAAVADFGRAVALDSTFALAAVELASTAGLQIKARPTEAALADQGWWSEADSTWERAVELASRERRRLEARDLDYFQALAGVGYPRVSNAVEQLVRWEQIVQAQPDRADAWHHFGLALLHHAPSVGVADARERAATAFRRALATDSAFAGALLGLLEVAAFAGDTGETRRLGQQYLARYPGSDEANYVRWRVAARVGDLRSLHRLRQRFDSLSPGTLVRIQWTSQVEGIALEDAERAVEALLSRAGGRVERSRAVGLATILHLNRGRPRQALAVSASVADLSQVPYWNPRFRVVYALYWSGDSTEGARSAEEVERRAHETLAGGAGRHNPEAIRPVDLLIPAQWRLWQGDTTLVARAVTILRASAPSDTGLVRGVLASGTPPRLPQGSSWTHRAVLLEAILASVARRSDAAPLRTRLDSLTRLGCCATPHYTGFVLARLYERAGDLEAALDAIRRARWYFPPEYLSTALREEGRLAALTGDREGAIRAYRHFLTLWEQAEPEQARKGETVRAELRRLEAARR